MNEVSPGAELLWHVVPDAIQIGIFLRIDDGTWLYFFSFKSPLKNKSAFFDAIAPITTLDDLIMTYVLTSAHQTPLTRDFLIFFIFL